MSLQLGGFGRELGWRRLHAAMVSASGSSIEAFLPSQISESADIGKAEGETVQVFIAQVGDGVAAVFEGDAAAVPVVCCLRGRKLEFLGFRIKPGASRGAQATFSEASVTQGQPELLKFTGDLSGAAHRAALALSQPRLNGAGL